MSRCFYVAITHTAKSPVVSPSLSLSILKYQKIFTVTRQ